MRLAAARNLIKVWALVLALCATLGLLGFAAGGYRVLSSVVFCALLAAAAAYWYADRVVMGMVGARGLRQAEAVPDPGRASSRARSGPRATWIRDRSLARAARGGAAGRARRRSR